MLKDQDFIKWTILTALSWIFSDEFVCLFHGEHTAAGSGATTFINAEVLTVVPTIALAPSA